MITKSVADIIQNHVTLEVEGIDRMYLNGYISRLQSPEAVAFFIRNQFDTALASTRTIEPMTRKFRVAVAFGGDKMRLVWRGWLYPHHDAVEEVSRI